MSLAVRAQEISLHVSNMRQSLVEQIDVQRASMDASLKDFREAAQQGDYSENAAFIAAKESVAASNVQIARLTAKHAIFEELEEERYRSIGMVTEYSTVHLRSAEGVDRVVRIYPKNVSDSLNGIISSDSAIAQRCKGRTVGEKFIHAHKITGKETEYTIVEIV